jgi:hypothetical protein
MKPRCLSKALRRCSRFPLLALLARFLPDAAGPLRTAVACMYTNTPTNIFFLTGTRTFPRS